MKLFNRYILLGRFCNKFKQSLLKDLEFQEAGLRPSVLPQFVPEREILWTVDNVNVRVGLAVFQSGVCLVLGGEHWL